MTKLELARKLKQGENWSMGYHTMAEIYSREELLEMYRAMRKAQKMEKEMKKTKRERTYGSI